MKKLILSFAILFSAQLMVAQCVSTMSSGTINYQVDGDHSNSGDQLWLCRNLTFEISGDNNNAWVEFGADLLVSGDNNNVFIKGAADLELTGMGNTVYHENNVTAKPGTGNTLNACDTVVIDYKNAPSTGGCDVAAGLSDAQFEVVEINVYPNPAKDRVFVDQNGNFEIERYEVISINGQVVLNGTLNVQNNSISVETLEAGMYIFKMYTNYGSVSQRISVE